MKAKDKIFVLAMLVLAGGVGACTPAAPGTPSYERDVRPIFMANCVRCHGAGGTLRNEVDAEAFPGRAPSSCYLNFYDDEGDCGTDGGPAAPDCRRGAHTCAVTWGPVLMMYVDPPPGSSFVMPPPPSELLNSWELDVLDRWLKDPIR